MIAVTDPEALLGLDDAAFHDLVNQHVPRRSDPDGSVWSALHDPALIERTYAALIEMVREVDSLLTTRAAELEAFRQDCYRRGEPGKRDWHQADADFKVWRGRALGWKRLLEPRLMVAKERRRQARMDRTARSSEEQAVRTALRQLALAVHRHQAASRSEDISPEPHDQTLWAALDQLTVPHGELAVTLRSLIDSGAWT
jgi:hypothetical protein